MDPLTRLFGDAAAGHQAFADQYQQAPASIPPAEAIARHDQVAPQLPPPVYQESAEQVLARLAPEERVRLGRYLMAQAQAEGAGGAFPDVNHDGIDDRLQDPRVLAQGMTQLQQQRPGLLGQILGRLAGPAGLENSPAMGGAPIGGVAPSGLPGGALASAALGGIAALGLSRLARGGGGLLGGLTGGMPGGWMGGYPGGEHGWGRRKHDDDDD